MGKWSCRLRVLGIRGCAHYGSDSVLPKGRRRREGASNHRLILVTETGLLGGAAA